MKQIIKDVLFIIDPGHGGWDTGAVANGLIEKSLTLQDALELKKNLQPYFENIIMTRDSDKYFDVASRAHWVAQKASEFLKNNPNGKVICLSIHFNAFNGTARGCEAIYSIHSKEDLAKAIAAKICELGIPLRRVFSKESESQPGKGIDYYCMHRETGAAQTVIVESLFLDSADDASLIKQTGFIQKLAAKQAEGLLQYMNVKIVQEQPEQPVQPKTHWAKEENDALIKAGILVSDHTSQLDNPATEGLAIQLTYNLYNLLRKEGILK